jgi:hypothetical protein
MTPENLPDPPNPYFARSAWPQQWVRLEAGMGAKLCASALGLDVILADSYSIDLAPAGG